jgi:hypothetical protein
MQKLYGAKNSRFDYEYCTNRTRTQGFCVFTCSFQIVTENSIEYQNLETTDLRVGGSNPSRRASFFQFR